MSALVNPPFRVVEATAGESHLIPPLLYRVFGYTYTDLTLYGSDGVAAATAGQDNIFFVAIDNSTGEACGLVAMRFCYPSPAVAELGMLLVDPSLGPAASGSVLRMLGEALSRKSYILARERKLRCLISTEVTVHTLTQRLVEQFGFVTTGMYLGWTPAWAERLRITPGDRTKQSVGRTSAMLGLRRTETVSVLPFDKMIMPYDIAIPRTFEPVLSRLYNSLKLPARLVQGVPAEGVSVLVEDLNLWRGRVVLELTNVGADAAELILTRLAHYRIGLLDLIHVALPLTEVDIDPLIGALVASGARYGALLPLYRGHDVLMLQYLNTPFAPLAIHDLHSSSAKMLFREVISPSSKAPAVKTSVP